MLKDWLWAMIGLVILVMNYSIFGPFMLLLINITTGLGAPAAMAWFLFKMFNWGFMIFGVACVMVPFLKAWRRTYDQGQYPDRELRYF